MTPIRHPAVFIAIASLAVALPGQDNVAKRVELQDPSPTVRILGIEKLVTRDFPRIPEQGIALDAGIPTPQFSNIAPFASRFVQPPLRDSEEIKSLGRRSLVAFVRPRQHAWLQKFVEFNAALGSHVMNVECKFVRMDDRAFRKVAEPLLRKNGRRLPHVVLAKGKKTDTFLANLERFRGVEVIHSPSLTTYPAQRANLSLINQVSYIKDFQPEFNARGEATAFDPVIGIANSGMWMDCQCGMIEEGIAGLTVHARCSEMKTPIRTVEMQVKDFATPLKIQVPELDVATIKADVRLPVGGAVVFELAKIKSGHTLAFITVTQIPQEEVKAPADRRR